MLVIGTDEPTTQDVKDAKLGEFIAKTGELPTLPQVAQQMLQLLQQPEVSQTEIADTLERDPGLSAQILRIVNSAFYGLSRKVLNLRHAISMLGMHEIRNLVLTTASRGLFKKFGPPEQALWQHSLSSAVAARLVASGSAREHKDVSFLVGQMHDVGTILLQLHMPNLGLRSSSPDEESDRLAELESFGFSHTDIGALLMSQWNMPEELEAAAFYHHDLELCSALEPDRVHVVALAVVADCITRPDPYFLTANLTAALDVLDLSPGRFSILSPRWRQQAFAEAASLGL